MDLSHQLLKNLSMEKRSGFCVRKKKSSYKNNFVKQIKETVMNDTELADGKLHLDGAL